MDSNTNDASVTPEDSSVIQVAETPAVIYQAVTDVPEAFIPRKGFETVLYGAFGQPHSAASVVAELLANGEYNRVAPRAAELRPFTPVNTLITRWLAAGVIKTVAAGADEFVTDEAADSQAA